jgi:hypothetical protein
MEIATIMDVESIQELDELLEGLPIWPRMHTSVRQLMVLAQSTVGDLPLIPSAKSTSFPFSSQTESVTPNWAVTYCNQDIYTNLTNSR